MNKLKAQKSILHKLERTLARATIVAGFLFGVLNGVSQNAPVLTVAPTGTNQILISITNGVSTASYELWWTPMLANPAYPWTTAAVGTTGQTNFTLSTAIYPAGFYEVVQDTNSIPLWQGADPHNQAAGILNVWIDNPTNGMTLN